jgi:hypothetical protein
MAATVMAGPQMELMGARRQPRSRAATLAERNRELFELQRKARRGPTPEVFFAKHIDNSRIVKADDPERRREMRTFSAVMSVLFVLVMVYVWQHFSAIEMGYNIEAQKVTDPERIDVLAKQMGLSAPQPGQVVRPDGIETNATVLAQAHLPKFVGQ